MKIKEIKNKIDKVFTELEKVKVQGKQNFWCCQTCGGSAMEDYGDTQDSNGEYLYDGYVFYHSQDYDTLKSDGYTYLSFAGFRDVSGIDIANRIIKAFQDECIDVEWNGDTNARIKIDFINHEKTN
jgi:hypothetical protein